MADVARISVDEAQEHVKRGALLVCAYEDEEKCGRMKLEGSMTLRELEARLPSLPKDQEIIFYCA
jgi:rhodanese-related sulfurtransferase